MKKLGLAASFTIYLSAGILLYVVTRFLIPWLSAITGQETIFFWFTAGGLLVFLPLIITGIVVLRSEGYTLSKATWVQRLRFRKLTRRDLAYSVGGVIAVGVLSMLVMQGLEKALGNFSHQPPFMVFEPLSAGRYWLLLVWLPFWILNIMGEEFLWRGVMLPRQELVFGRFTWLIHASGWLLFHVAFGWQLLITLIPIIYIQSWVVQRTRNSWTGVIIHAGLNGPGFIAISLGMM